MNKEFELGNAIHNDIICKQFLGHWRLFKFITKLYNVV